jgi:hypothetical protein
MIETSEAFARKIEASVRRSRAIVLLDFLPDVIHKPSITTTSEKEGYPVGGLLQGRLSLDESNSVGEYIPASNRGTFNGWRSAESSNPLAQFDTPPVIEITYEEEIESKHVWLVSSALEYLVDFKVTITSEVGEAIVLDVTDNQQAIWSHVSVEAMKIKTIRLEVLKNNIEGKDALIINFGAVKELVLTDAELVDYDVLEEVTYNEALPYGGVSSNEYTFAVDNLSYMFTPANDKGPLFGLLAPGVGVKSFYGLEIEPEVFEYVPLGVYFVSEWNAPSQGVQATITSYDLLFDLQEESVPMLRMQENTTIAELLLALFEGLGLAREQYEVDSNINDRIPYGFIPEGNVGAALAPLCEAGICRVCVNRFGVVRATRGIPTKEAVLTWDDVNQVMEIENPEKFNAIYGKVTVAVNIPSLRRTSDLATINEIEVNSGDTFFERASYSKAPVLSIDSVSVRGGTGTRTKEIAYGTNNIDITLENGSKKSETVGVFVQGVYCSFVSREVSGLTPGATSKKVLPIKNQLIQTEIHAMKLIQAIAPAVADSFAYFELVTRGDPRVEVGDVLKIKAPSANIPDQYIEVYRASHSYDGAIEGRIVGRRLL